MKNPLKNLKNPFRRVVVLPPSAHSMQVREVDRNEKTLTGALGLSDERARALQQAVLAAYHSSDNLVQAAEKFSADCTHPNELFFCAHVMVSHHSQTNRMGGLMKMLGSLGGE